MSVSDECISESPPTCSDTAEKPTLADEVLRVEGLRTEFKIDGESVPIVDGLDFRVRQGRCLALVGESGCGKSMTALSLMRLVPRPGAITSGKIVLSGRDLRDLDVLQMRKVRGQEASMIFQEPMTSLHPVMRVGAQVSEAIRLHEKISRKAARLRGIEAFQQVGMPHPEAQYDAFPHELSGGLKQRVMIAMAIVTRPSLLIADEPTTALDVTIQAQILELLKKLMTETRTAILLITHDLGVVNQIADDLCVMYAGRIVEQGPCRAILQNPQHPYTQGLLASLPQRSRSQKRLYEIPGQVPPPSNWASGCRFAPRCTEKGSRCQSETPALIANAAGEQSVACFARAEGKGL